MSDVVLIYVALLDEGVDVWRPVKATRIGDNTYHIVPQPYDRRLESWQFEPGDLVHCEIVQTSNGRILAATRLATKR